MIKTNTKQIEYVELMKTFKTFVSKKAERPVLKLVHFDGKNFVATNSHILLVVKSEYVKNIPANIIEGSLINPLTVELHQSNEALKYPNVSRLIPSEYDTNTTIGLDGQINDLIKGLKVLTKSNRAMNGLTPSSQIAILDVKQDLSISIKDDETKEKLNIENVQGEKVLLHLNAKYLIDALTTCKKLSKLNDNKCTLNITGRLRPMNFKQENVFDLIVLPVRIY
jgi:hypothetical protein